MATTDAMYVFSPEELQDMYINRLNITYLTANHTDWIDDFNYSSTTYTDWFDALKYDLIFNDDLNFIPPHYNYTLPDDGNVYILNKTLCGGNALPGDWLKNGFIDQPSWDTTPPSIHSINLINNAVNVPVNKTIKFTFTEKIKENTNWIELKNSAGKAIPFKSWINEGKYLFVDPKNKLPEAKYKLILHTGSVTDMQGNPFHVVSYSFTVGTSPTIKTSDPKNSTTKVSRYKPIKVTFSENIKASKKYWIELKTSGGKSEKITKSISGKVLTIKHSTKLKASTRYKLILHTGAVTDKAGNPLTLKTISFKTGNT